MENAWEYMKGIRNTQIEWPCIPWEYVNSFRLHVNSASRLTNPEAPLSRANVAETVIAGCRRRLLVDRHASLEALKCGFTFKGIDGTLQLAVMPRPVVLLLTRGKVALSAEELMDSFDWDVASTGLEQRVPGFLRDFIHGMGQLGRLRFLRWCTGVNALPADGLRHGVTLLPLENGSAAADACLPQAANTHTHTHTHTHTLTRRS